MNNQTWRYLSSLALVVGMSALGACSSSSTGTAPNSSTEALASFPVGFAVSSPTSEQSASGSSTSGLRTKAAFDSSLSYLEKQEEMAALATASTLTSCQIQLPNFTAAPTVSCYGPNLDYKGHTDGSTDGNDTDEGAGDDDGQLPSGDLGIWASTDTDGTACAAAKMNAEINAIAARVDAGLILAASFNCVMNASGESLPAEGEELDLTSTISTTLAAANAGFSLTEASISRLTDLNGLPVYQYRFTGSIGSNAIDFNLKHHSTDDSNDLYIGQMWAKMATGGADNGFSVQYEKTATAINYLMYSANFPSSTADADMFTSGVLKINGTWNGNIAMTKANINATTGLGAAIYSWQAGTGDSQARIFNAYTTTSGSDTVGYGWFGFGLKFNNGTGVASDGVIDRFICNWAGPSNSHTGQSGKAQKQIMKLVSEQFVPSPDVGDANLIDYAPVNSCDLAAASGMNYQSTTSAYSAPTGSHAAVTNELVTLSSDTDYAAMPTVSSPTTF